MSYINLKPGDLIISSPFTENDLIFHKSVILITTHDRNGTSGIVINKVIGKVNRNEIMKGLKLSFEQNLSLSEQNLLKEVSKPTLITNQQNNISPEKMSETSTSNINIIFGGPVDSEKGVILHSNDYINSPIIKISSELSISSDTKIILDILSNAGPKFVYMVLGFCAWQASQLVDEIKKNEWVILPLNTKSSNSENFELIFSQDHAYKWNKALKLAGISLGHYNNQKSQA